MSMNSEHLKQLVRDLGRESWSETRHDGDLRSIDILSSILETAHAERDRLVSRVRKGDSPCSWAAIGLACGMSKQAAQHRWTEKKSTPVDEDQLSLPGTGGSR